MANGLIGRKLGMTRVFAEDGTSVPVTVIEAGPCRVLQVQGRARCSWASAPRCRSAAARRSWVTRRRPTLDAAPQDPQGVRAAGEASYKPGDTVTVGIFAAGELVKVTGTTKGRGFQGMVHRYRCRRRSRPPTATPGTGSRAPSAPGTDPSRVIKGKRMPGHMGAERHTELGLRVVKIDAERNLLFVRGAVPGARARDSAGEQAARQEPP